MPFESVKENLKPFRPRLILSLSGEEKSGKTDFAMRTGPEPVYYICFDPNGELIADKIVRETGRDIRRAVYDRKKNATRMDNEAMWQLFLADVAAALKAIDAAGQGTLAVDTFTDAYELCRLALLGKLSQVQPHHYGPVNAAMKALINDIYDSSANAVLINRMRDEYANDKATGRREVASWGNVAYAVQANALCFTQYGAEDGPFYIRVDNCNLNMGLSQMVFSTKGFTFEAWLWLLQG